MQSEIHVTSCFEHVSAVLQAEGGGVAEASFIGKMRDGTNEWYVNRVLVTDSEHRGKGVGSALLQKMIEAIVARGPCEIIVEPGGYGADPESQKNFYLKNGFKKTGLHFTWSSKG